ncbi:unnamed protein product [Thelazia callipaeda]|uniref:Activin_recp domain-containing protein n=1 Tax=Thelazia callipaeda TaxID=103827 RepID=A0A0N5D6J4_THECL|nr:unnamed protein product [Thelazia callipaeda]
MKELGFIVLLLNRYSQSLLCYDCYEMEPSNEKCTKLRNCTGEACILYEDSNMLLTTAFCLLNLPEHYQNRIKITDAECWMETNGKGIHCICSKNFCNKLRDRRNLQNNKLPIANATMIKLNPLIDYNYDYKVGDFKTDFMNTNDEFDDSSKG